MDQKVVRSTRSSRLKTVLYTLIVICFVVAESPLILWANRIEPMILGLPFLIGWVIIWWAVTIVLYLIGYLTNWGEGSSELG
ncbi:MAG: hypothetical protein ACUVXJ_19610 [Phycisphaerae bacterium]